MTPAGSVMVASHDPRLVALSILVSIVAAYAARDLFERVFDARGRAWLAWLLGAATADGIGTWSMHYTAILALRLPVPILFDAPMVVLSLLVGVVGSAATLMVLRRRPAGWRRACVGGLVLGGVGISGLHYTAMAAMRIPGGHHYSSVFVALSVGGAVVATSMALGIDSFFRDDARGRRLRHHGGALLRGLANPAMHYTAMATMTFTVTGHGDRADLSRMISFWSLGILGSSIVPVMVLVVGFLTSLIDRLRKQGALLEELFQQAPQPVALLTADHRIVRVNRDFTQVFGYTPEEAIGRRLADLILPDESRDEAQQGSERVARGERVEQEGVRRRKDGRRLDVSIVRVPVSVPGGQIEVYEIYRDITERKRAEQELRRLLYQLRALAGRLETVREDERTRVAREIHDVMGQALTAIKIDLLSLLHAAPADQTPDAQRGRAIVRLLDDTIQSVRRIATELRPGILDSLGLVPALEWAAEEFQARTGTRVRVSVPEGDIAVEPDRATALFRIFQETLTNVARHASATRVDVRLTRENGNLILEVRDDGCGVSEDEVWAGSSLGLIGMRERALLLGGELTIRGTPGAGTTVRVRIPETEGASRV